MYLIARYHIWILTPYTKSLLFCSEDLEGAVEALKQKGNVLLERGFYDCLKLMRENFSICETQSKGLVALFLLSLHSGVLQYVLQCVLQYVLQYVLQFVRRHRKGL